MLEEIFYTLGQQDAAALRQQAASMDGTAILRQAHRVSDFVPGKDYSAWPAGAPAADGGQIWVLLQPYNSAAHPGRPEQLRALWGLCHTRDPERAREFVPPRGISGLYAAGECCRQGGRVYRCLQDGTAHGPEALPGAWEQLT